MSFFCGKVFRAFSRRLNSLRSVMKIFAARMGPTVWDDDGPTSKSRRGEKKKKKNKTYHRC